MSNPKLPQILFFDFDNTLMDSKTHEIPQSALKALKHVHAKGYQLAIASGRNYPLLKMTGVFELLEWSGFILNNGQLILDHDESPLQHLTLDPKAIQEIIKQARSLGFNLFFSSPEGDFMDKEADDLMIQAHAFFNEPIPKIEVYTHQLVDKILVYAPKGYDYAPFKAIEGISIFPSVSTYADIASEGVSKASSIETFLKLKHLPHDYAAFGDSMNDMEMLEHARLSIAMGNGEDALKSIADVIAPNISEDGIAKVLKTLGYLEE